MKPMFSRQILVALLALTPFTITLAAPPEGRPTDGSAPLGIDESEEIAKAKQQIEEQWLADLEAVREGRTPSSVRRSLERATAIDLSALSSGGPYYCLPSCSVTDGRFLSLSGQGFSTLAGDSINLVFGFPASATQIEIGIFDPDTSGNWDFGSFPAGVGIQAVLKADADADGVGTTTKGSWTFDSTFIAYNNGWYTITLPTSLDARAPSGNYFYALTLTNPQPSSVLSSNFKIRTTGSVALKPQAFAFMVPVFSMGDLTTLYPSYPSVNPTTYDGRFDLHFVVPAGQHPSRIDIWDGDMDYGSDNCASADTNDPDTPGSPFLPSWAVGTAAVPEGVAVGLSKPCGMTTGNPPDDAASPIFYRTPSIAYTITSPAGTVYSNGNPSGNLEWERFRFGSGSMPSGVYHIDLIGCDLANLNAWRATYDVICVKDGTGPNGELIPCDPPFCPCCGTGTIGYWKNHASAWPGPYVTVGGVQYSVSQAIALMKQSVAGDKTYSLFSQLVAAKLNVLMGNDSSCIAAQISLADAWMALHPPGSGVAADSQAWQGIAAAHTDLDSYNNGNLCAKHRDSVNCGNGC